MKGRAMTRDQAKQVLMGYPPRTRVADHYDFDTQFGVALRTLVGDGFRYPAYSWLTIREAIKKAAEV